MEKELSIEKTAVWDRSKHPMALRTMGRGLKRGKNPAVPMPPSDQGVILVLCSSHATQVLTCALLRLAEVTAVTQDPLRAACCFHLHQGVL